MVVSAHEWAVPAVTEATLVVVSPVVVSTADGLTWSAVVAAPLPRCP